MDLKRRTQSPNRAPQKQKTRQKRDWWVILWCQGVRQRWCTRSRRRRRAVNVAGPPKTQVFLHVGVSAAPAIPTARPVWTAYAAAARIPIWPMARRNWKRLRYQKKPWNRRGSRLASTSPASQWRTPAAVGLLARWASPQRQVHPWPRSWRPGLTRMRRWTWGLTVEPCTMLSLSCERSFLIPARLTRVPGTSQWSRQ